MALAQFVKRVDYDTCTSVCYLYGLRAEVTLAILPSSYGTFGLTTIRSRICSSRKFAHQTFSIVNTFSLPRTW